MDGTRLPNGTPVLVVQRIPQTDPSLEARTAGVIDSCEEEPTGAWYAHGRNGKLWISRLHLRKADRELTTLTIDEQTQIYPLAAAKE